ncbi:discoidin domain-containing protein [Sporosarcina sp. NPDC096371]|uniref:discoidin domain-containing protein n=1 Tax=Sporosarcina sp. NPDC096371 TaxID=3364530 RepID=UPI0038126D41
MTYKPRNKRKKVTSIILSSFLVVPMLMGSITTNGHVAYANEIVSQTDIVDSAGNHALGKNVKVNNFEGVTIGANAVDGKLGTHWGTVPRSSFAGNPELVVDLGNVTKVKSFLIHWERQSAAQNIVNYDILTSEDNQVWHTAFSQTEKVMKQRHTINLEKPVNAKYIKLVVTKYDGGTLNYHNVGVKEFEVYSNDVISLDDITSIDYNRETMKLEIPKATLGEITLVGSNSTPVIDLEGNVRKPLVQKDVKVSLQHESETGIKTTREFTVSVEGQFDNEGVNSKPEVIPALSEWHGLQGTMKIDDTTKVFVKDPKFTDAANMLIEDLRSIGLNLSLSEVEAENTIVFAADDANNYEEEGYGMEIEDNKITISAAHHTGAFFATRSLHQILKQSDTKEINNGYVRDYPKFPVRGLMLDVGRKFTELDYIYDLMKTMSYYKMNDFQIHLNDNYIFLADYANTEDALYNAYEGFRLESDIEGNDQQLTSDDGHYTKDEFRKLISDSAKHGITIVPEFETPAHAMSLIKVRPDLMYKGAIANGKTDQERAAMLDLDNPNTLPFIKSMYDEYLDGDNPVFADVPIHIGSDEYYGGAEVYRKYADDMLKFIRDDKQRTVRIWGSLSSKRGNTPVTSENVQMQVWNTGWAEPSAMLDQGFDIINIDDGQVYLVPDAGYYYDYLNIENLFKNYKPNKFSNGVVIDESHPQFLGGMFALWNDQVDKRENGITSFDMFDRLFDAIPVMAQKNWGSELEGSFEEFKNLSSEVGYAPNSNPRFSVESATDSVLEYDFLKGTEDQSGNNYNLLKENNTTLNNGLSFNGKDSYVETPLMNLGPKDKAKLEVEVTVNQTDKEQVLMETDGFGTIYAVNKDGYVGYKYENNEYSFNYKLEANKKTNLLFTTALHKTRLFVDGKEVHLTADTVKKNNTLVLPIQRIGGLENTLDGTITKLHLSLGGYIDPTVIEPKHFTVTATSEEKVQGNTMKEGPIKLAFDGDESTMWHSAWNKTPALPYEVTINLNEVTKINKMTYLPRQDAGPNGHILQYELLISDDGKDYRSISKGDLANNKLRKDIEFETVDAKFVKFIVLNGVGGFASAAEFTLHKAVDLPDELNKDALYRLIEEAKAISNDNGVYTVESFQTLQNAIKVAEAASESIKTEAELAAAMASLQAAIDGLVTSEKVVSAAGMKKSVERFLVQGEFKNELAARSLTTHLTAVAQYEKQATAEKVVKHMKSFIVLLDYQKENDLISDKAYNALKADTNDLIKKWQ